jgi:hypothetical protein
MVSAGNRVFLTILIFVLFLHSINYTCLINPSLISDTRKALHYLCKTDSYPSLRSKSISKRVTFVLRVAGG